MESIPKTLLIGKTRIALTKLDVGDEGIEALLFAEGKVGMAEIIAVSSDRLAFKIVGAFADLHHILLGSLHHGSKILVILGAECLGMQDDLMFVIDQGLGIVALNDAMRGGHLGGLVIGEIALDLFGAFPDLGLVRLKEGIEAFDLACQAIPLALAALLFGGGCILTDVLSDLLFELLLEFVSFVLEFLKGTAPLLGSIGRQFETIQAEVGTTKEIQLFTDQQNVAEDGFDLDLHGGDKMSDGAVIGVKAAAESHEEDVLAAGTFDFAGSDHTASVCKEDDFEKDLGIDRLGPGAIVLITRLKDG